MHGGDSGLALRLCLSDYWPFPPKKNKEQKRILEMIVVEIRGILAPLQDERCSLIKYGSRSLRVDKE